MLPSEACNYDDMLLLDTSIRMLDCLTAAFSRCVRGPSTCHSTRSRAATTIAVACERWYMTKLGEKSATALHGRTLRGEVSTLYAVDRGRG